MSNLVDHARTELELIGEEPETIELYLKVIQAFADMGHSGGSASIAIPTINHLLQFKNLSKLTNDPDEWQDHGPQSDGGHLWQNKRNPEAFSLNGGNTYYLISELKGKKRVMHYSMPKNLEQTLQGVEAGEPILDEVVSVDSHSDV